MVTQITHSRSNTQTRHSAGLRGTHLLTACLYSRNCCCQTKHTYVIMCCLFIRATRFKRFSIDTIKAKHAACLQRTHTHREINLETTDWCSGRDPNLAPRWRLRHKKEKLISSHKVGLSSIDAACSTWFLKLELSSGDLSAIYHHVPLSPGLHAMFLLANTFPDSQRAPGSVRIPMWVMLWF